MLSDTLLVSRLFETRPLTHLGKLVVPIGNASIARAQSRPSQIAQMTSDFGGSAELTLRP